MDKLTQYNVTNVAYTLSHITHTEFSSERELRKLIRNYCQFKPARTIDILLIWLKMRRAGSSVRRVYGAPHIFETNHHLLSLPPSLVGVAVAYGGMECRARSPAQRGS